MRNAVIPVDKPRGPTSFDVLRRLRARHPIERIGHAGTLDPMATGLLVVLTGRATRLASLLGGREKSYEAGLRLGIATDTDDEDGRVVERVETFAPDPSLVAGLPARFSGTFEQRLPAYAARKVAGRRMYRLARAGMPEEGQFKQVTVESLEITEYSPPFIHFRVRCSAGTYVRALGRDMAAALGLPGHLCSLRRIATGPFGIESALPLDALLDLPTADFDAAGHEGLMRALAGLPQIPLPESAVSRVLNGAPIELAGLETDPACLPEEGATLVLMERVGGRVLALARREQGRVLVSTLLFP